MWFQFPQDQHIISVERQVFVPEYTDDGGREYFRAPNHFKDKLVAHGECVALGGRPVGVPDDLPDFTIPNVVQEDQLLAMKQELSDERSTSSALRAELAASLHERDTLALQVHELTEEVEALKSRMADEGIEEDEPELFGPAAAVRKR